MELRERAKLAILDAMDVQDGLDIVAAEKYADAALGSQWQPIEAAPLPRFSRRDWFDRRFACLIAGGRGVELGVFSYTGRGEGVWCGYGVGPSHRVHPTHWMPLPAAPLAGIETGTAETAKHGSVPKG